jgi:acylphosphatase
VQGVGFRYTVKNLAMQYDVHGYVKNMPDGSVELVVEGPDSEMQGLIEELNRKMNPYIAKVEQVEAPATGEFNYFAIKH